MVCYSFSKIAEKLMYYGGGILGTILIIALIVWLVRRV
jgi:nitrate reductase gamma subunit